MGLITGAGGRYGEGQVGSKGFNWSMDFTDAATEGVPPWIWGNNGTVR